MSVASDTVETVPRLHLPHRPTWLLSIALDALFGIAAYLAAYWLRFRGDQLVVFLPGAWWTMPFVVGGQLAALGVVRAYGRRSRIDWLGRVVGGIVIGTAVSSVLLGLTIGFEGVSRSAFVADAVLLSIGAVAWRGLWVLRARALARAAVPAALADDLVDRTEMMTLGGVVASLYHYRGLLKNLVLKDLKLKYRGSVFGFMWSLLNPLLMIVVYTVAFTFILRIRTAGFVFYLMLGQLSWAFFANSASMSTGAIVDNAGLLKSVLFPRAILPIGTVLFNLAQYLLTMSVFLPVMMVWYQVPLEPPMLLFPVFLALQVAFTIGVALMVASCTVFFRDVRHLLEVGLAALFWATPIVYEFRQVPEQLRLMILIGPVSPFVVAYEQLFFYRQWPDGTVWMMAIANAVGAFVLGSLIFLAVEDRFVEQL
jgi:lipopolysaccharide transport system permease protein